MDLEVERPSVVIPISAEALEDALDVPDYWALIRQGFEAAQQDAEWLARLPVRTRWRVLRMRALIRRTRDVREEREREARICPCCGCDPDEHGDVNW